jgi:hypothetical protein
MAEIQEVIQRSETTRFEGQWSLTGLILSGIKEKLRHMERSRKSRRNRKQKVKLPVKLICEECDKEIVRQDGGQFTLTPEGVWFVQCWPCYLLCGPFVEGPISQS